MRLPTASDIDALARRLVLPEPFLLGTAGSGFQIEGGFNGPGEPRNNWHAWERRPGNDVAGAATRFWNDPARDLDLARGLSLNAFRLGLEWARIQPAGPDAWDTAAIDAYATIIRETRARGLEPIVTLHHFTHPAWAGDDFWLEEDAPARFAAFVRGLLPRLLNALGDTRVQYWITINEPNVLAPATYLSAWLPSATKSGTALGRLARSLDSIYAAHVLACDAIHEACASPAVSFNNFALDLYGLDRFFVDLLLSRSRGISGLSALSTDLRDRRLAWSQSLHGVTAHAHALSATRGVLARGVALAAARFFVPSRFPRTLNALARAQRARPLDYLALDYYDPAIANGLRFLTGTYDPWDWTAYPDGLYDVLRANGNDGLPVLIAENGMATRRFVDGAPEPRADGVTRDAFLRAHLFHVLRAASDGIPVLGYLHWSLTDNYEWGRFSPRFGLFGVDYTHPDRPRLPTDASGVNAADTYARIARALRDRNADALAAALRG